MFLLQRALPERRHATVMENSEVGGWRAAGTSPALALYVSVSWNRSWNVPMPDVKASSDPAVIARGEYLATGPAHCVECHMGSVEEYLSGFAGEGRIGRRWQADTVSARGRSAHCDAKEHHIDRETGIGRFSRPADRPHARATRREAGRPGVDSPRCCTATATTRPAAVVLRMVPAVRQRRARERVVADGARSNRDRSSRPSSSEARRQPGPWRHPRSVYGGSLGRTPRCRSPMRWAATRRSTR